MRFSEHLGELVRANPNLAYAIRGVPIDQLATGVFEVPQNTSISFEERIPATPDILYEEVPPIDLPPVASVPDLDLDGVYNPFIAQLKARQDMLNNMSDEMLLQIGANTTNWDLSEAAYAVYDQRRRNRGM